MYSIMKCVRGATVIIPINITCNLYITINYILLLCRQLFLDCYFCVILICLLLHVINKKKQSKHVVGFFMHVVCVIGQLFWTTRHKIVLCIGRLHHFLSMALITLGKSSVSNASWRSMGQVCLTEVKLVWLKPQFNIQDKYTSSSS